SMRGLPLPRGDDRGVGWAPIGSGTAADLDGYGPPARVALLLPERGPLAPAGRAVREGFLAAYLEEPRARPEVLVSDTGSPGGGGRGRRGGRPALARERERPVRARPGQRAGAGAQPQHRRAAATREPDLRADAGGGGDRRRRAARAPRRAAGAVHRQRRRGRQ